MKKRSPYFIQRVIKHKGTWIVIGFLVFLWLNNTSLFVNRTGKEIILLAHAALGQTYDLQRVKWDTNTAAIINEPEHPYIENTLPSIHAAFDYGADIVEFDIQLTADDTLAVFHDYLLDYRTDGSGYVSEHTMDELRLLDVGYGYTSDGGASFPFRGKGIGLMVSIEDVIHAFPDKRFLIHIKDGREKVGPILMDFLATLDESTISNLSAYGNDQALDLLRSNYPEIKVFSKYRLKHAFLSYLAIGWTGIVPEAIRNMELHVPIEYARFLWGWPNRFLQRMENVNTQVVLVRYVNGWSDGFDSVEDLDKLPEGFSGGIWTNRIDIIGPLLRE